MQTRKSVSEGFDLTISTINYTEAADTSSEGTDAKQASSFVLSSLVVDGVWHKGGDFHLAAG